MTNFTEALCFDKKLFVRVRRNDLGGCQECDKNKDIDKVFGLFRTFAKEGALTVVWSVTVRSNGWDNGHTVDICTSSRALHKHTALEHHAPEHSASEHSVPEHTAPEHSAHS